MTRLSRLKARPMKRPTTAITATMASITRRTGIWTLLRAEVGRHGRSNASAIQYTEHREKTADSRPRRQEANVVPAKLARRPSPRTLGRREGLGVGRGWRSI